MSQRRLLCVSGRHLRVCFILKLVSPAYTFRKEGHTKIIEYDLTKKQKNSLQGLKRPNVLREEKLFGDLPAKEVNGSADQDGDVEMDVDGPESSPEPSDDEGEPTDPAALPKSASGKVKTARGRAERVVIPEECRAHLRRLFRREALICSLLYGRHGHFAPLTPAGFSLASPDIFFIDVIPITPTRFRPPAKMNDTLFEHPQNELLSKVLKTSYRLRDLNNDLREASEKTAEMDEANRRRILSMLLDSVLQLQVDVNSFMDSNKNPSPMPQGKLPPAGVKQLLEKKEGLFRKHMMV